jgi:CRP-like cAMP-binding protein
VTLTCGNLFLDALPLSARDACLAISRRVQLQPGDVLGHKGEPYTVVHFPVSGMISEVEEGRDGGSAEVTIIGFEGCSGIEALLESDRHPFLRCVELPTEALAISVSPLRAIRDGSPEFSRFVHRYVAARLRGLGISSGCYARHPVTARLARWLLRVLDRSAGVEFALTHDTLALMLGVRRSTVSRAIEELSAAGAITSGRGTVRVRSRERLEELCCSCYPDGRDVHLDLYGERYINEIS